MTETPTVLLVDDDEMIRELVEARLGRSGYRIHTAADGQTGLDLARFLLPHVIVLDWMMPGLGGPEVCRLLKEDESTAGIPVLMLTSRANEEDIRAGFEHGADDYLTKPFEVSELDEALRRLLAPRS